jgi:hypothetical protein
MNDARPIGLVLAAALAVHVVIAAMAFADAPQPNGDFDRYYEIASASGRPYVDYQVEHPIGTLLVFKLIAKAAGTRSSFGRGVVLVSSLADAVLIAALWSVWGSAAAAYYAVVIVPISGLLFHRIDLWSMSAATLAIAAWRRRWPTWSGAALAIGVSFKLWPLVLIFALWWSDNRRKALTAFAVVVGSLAGLALLLAGWRSIAEVLTFRGATGWQIESTVGNIIQLVGRLPVRTESGAFRIGTLGRLTSTALFLAAAPVCLWASWRGFRTSRPGTAWLAAVAWLLTLSALLSAQYAGWLAPGAALAWTENHRRPALLAAAAVGLTQAFWHDYDAVRDGATAMLVIVLIRNLVLLVLAVDASLALAKTGDRGDLLSETDL